MGELTMAAIWEAYDRLWDVPPEPYWFLCHPDDLAWVRGVLGRDVPGKLTCPVPLAHPACQRGTILRVAIDHDNAWLWPWQRRGG